MGGYYSTRWGWERTRQDTDPLLKLDIPSLRKMGALRPGAVATITWSNATGDTTGRIITAMHRDGARLTLDYATRQDGETEWTPVREDVAIDVTTCNYGGTRPWFLCPGCNERRGVLFQIRGRFRCRNCHDLAYSSTRETVSDRSIRRAGKIHKRLGSSTTGLGDIPDKPAGMHWETYDHAVEDLRDAYAIQFAELRAFIARREVLLARLERENT